MSDDSEFWYCIKHSRVEGHDGCRNKDRLGPYATREEAERAIELAEKKTEEWENDPDWNDDASGDSAESDN